MKILKYSILAFIITTFFISCEEDKELTKINETDFLPAVLSGITANQHFTLVKDTTKVDSLKKVWVELTWSEADYGIPLATTYILQIDKVGNNFANAIEINNGSNKSIEILVETINNKMFNIANNYYPPLVEANVEIRIKSTVSQHIDPVYSTSTSFYLTPYDGGKPKLYVTGTHQVVDWDFASAPTLYSIDENESYVGYIYLTDCEYKLNKTPDISWGAGSTAGTIALGGSSLTNTVEGMYWITVDTLAETIGKTLRNWGIIGSATPGGWDTDTNMEFDFTTGKLKVTLDLTADYIKFRANDAWTINLGDDGADGIMEQGGADIKVSSAGNYTVYLDLRNPERFTYQLVKN